MTSNRWPPLLLSLGAALSPELALAQTAGEAADLPAGAGLQVQVGTLDSAPARSPLWQAVDAVHRQREQGAPHDRRLSIEQRQQLREQIRRAAMRGDAEPALRSSQLESR